MNAATKSLTSTRGYFYLYIVALAIQQLKQCILADNSWVKARSEFRLKHFRSEDALEQVTWNMLMVY